MQGYVKIIGLDEVQNTLNNTEKKLNDTAPLMAELASHLHNIVLDSFEEQKSPDGKIWTPIKQAKYQRHKSVGGGDKILYRNGKMQDSLYFDADKDTATVGLNAVSKKDGFPYPLSHQFGAKGAGRNRNITIDARPFMPTHKDGSLYDGVEKELNDIVWKYIEFVD